ncbi:MAG: glycoside hydrolase domain-containing protein, partial [Victivallales bacterium]
KVPVYEPNVRGRATLFKVQWRINPAEDNPYESYELEFRCGKDGKWELMGPLTNWAGKTVSCEVRDEMGPAGGKADTNWHSFSVNVKGDTINTMFDGDFHLRMRDTRIGQGVIAIRSIWDPKLSPEFIEIDDIKVIPASDANLAKISPAERLKQSLSRGCLFAYYPSENVLWTKFDFSRGVVFDRPAVLTGKNFTYATVQVRKKNSSAIVAETKIKLRDGLGPETRLKVPPLNGEYFVRFILEGSGGTATATIEKPLNRIVFPWEGNKLGFTKEIYPPFTPVRVEGKKVETVQRQYTMNGFGLWDSVLSQDRELLASPMTIRCTTSGGELKFKVQPATLKSKSAASAIFATEAENEAIRIKSVSTVEYDGCMKVEMTLEPGAKPVEIQSMWIEIPLKDSEMPLYHTYVDGMRINPAGKAPQGEGVVWQSGKAARRNTWLNSFCSYIWLGAEERGLAWFAENDRGWLTAKDGAKTPVQDIIREKDRLTMRIYLVNTPSVINSRHDLVFGLQASPVKPMPDGWRAKANYMPAISGPVNPWGGLSCSYKGPYRNDWTVVDRICEAHKTGKLDEEWLNEYVKKYNPPPVQGEWNWADSIRKFVNKWAVPRRPRPALVYAEEMAACKFQPEWWVFQDEWTILGAMTQRECLSDDEFRKGATGGGARITFPRTYQDYALWHHNEWLKRGVSLYWDNNHPISSANPRTSAAYVTENGTVQPALILWNQRDYMKRAWNLLQYWKRNQPDEVEWSIHRTNSQVLPLHGFGTISLDLEWSARYANPFQPDEIRTTVMGRQTGVYGHDHRELYGKSNPIMLEYEKQHPEWPGRVGWGMRMVHEMPRRSPPQAVELEKADAIAARTLEKIVVDFGYGGNAVTVYNYWADQPVLSVSDENVKWLALAKPDAKELMIVLSSWSDKAVNATVKIDQKALGFATGKTVTDAENGKAAGTLDGNDAFTVEIPAVYGVRILTLR